MNEKPEALRVADELKQYSGMAGLIRQQHESAWKAARLLCEQHEEIERLRAELKEDEGVIAVWRGRTQRAEAEIERLRADVERWKDLFDATDAVAGLSYLKQHYGGLTEVGWLRVFAKKAALDAAMAEERKP